MPAPLPSRRRLRLPSLAGIAVLALPLLGGLVVATAPIVSPPAAAAAQSSPGSTASTVSLTTATFGHLLHLVATVAPSGGTTAPTPTGAVDFYQSVSGANTYVGSASLQSGTATLTTTNVAPGITSIVANYDGDNVYAPSSTFAAVSVATSTPAPVVSVTTNANPVQWGSTGSVTATVTPPAGAPAWAPVPTGEVDLIDWSIGATAIGSGLLVNGSLTEPWVWKINAASYRIVANYLGSNAYPATSSSATVAVTPNVPTSTIVTSSNLHPIGGQQFTLTATVTTTGPNPPTGRVSFIINGGVISSPLNGNGQATFSPILSDDASVQAEYTGDANNQGSFSDSITETVTPPSPPIANAGPDQTTTSGKTITIDGSASTDPQNEPLTFSWSQVDGPAVTFEDEYTAKTKVTLPSPASATTVHLRLTVTNTSGLSATSVLGITINPK